jgi:hypothetical protein
LECGADAALHGVISGGALSLNLYGIHDK